LKIGRFFGRRAAALPWPGIADWGPPPLLPDPGAGDALLDAVLPLVAGRRCLLAWGDAPRVARMALAASAAGAGSVVVAHQHPPPEVDRILVEEARRLELEAEAARLLRRGRTLGPAPELGGALDCDALRPWWIAAELGSRDAAARAGAVDLVVDGSQLIHWQDPLARLRALAATGARHVVLETPLLTGELAGYAPGSVWYAVGMSAGQSLAAAAYWRERGVPLRQYEAMPHGFTAAQAVQAGLGGIAWWSFTDLAGIARLLDRAGLRLRRHRIVWKGGRWCWSRSDRRMVAGAIGAERDDGRGGAGEDLPAELRPGGADPQRRHRHGLHRAGRAARRRRARRHLAFASDHTETAPLAAWVDDYAARGLRLEPLYLRGSGGVPVAGRAAMAGGAGLRRGAFPRVAGLGFFAAVARRCGLALGRTALVCQLHSPTAWAPAAQQQLRGAGEGRRGELHGAALGRAGGPGLFAEPVSAGLGAG
jgi:hypothetical protein